MRALRLSVAFLLGGLLPALPTGGVAPPGLPAFPGAEGYGAGTVGGRGGRVLFVSTLDDAGPGSLRAAVEAEGPRTVVFRVGGTIVLRSELEIREPFITLAGQTAPGGGITLRNHSSHGESALRVKTHDVVVRYLRARPGPSAGTSNVLRALTVSNRRGPVYGVVVDHCSFSWSSDEIVNVWYDSRDVTLQWSIVSEGLENSNHGEGRHSRGILVGDQSTRVSLHHNLFAHNDGRNPRVQGGAIDIVNNVAYGARRTPARLDDARNPGSGRFNYIGNYHVRGPESRWRREVVLGRYAAPTSAYLEGNLGPNRPDASASERAVLDWWSRRYLAASRHPAPPVTTDPGEESYRRVLAQAGASAALGCDGRLRFRRDAVDQRIVSDVRHRTGGIIDHPDEVGGWPSLEPGAPCVDADGDGLADVWEAAVGLDAGDPGDARLDRDGDGYTNLEEFLNGSAPVELPPGAGVAPAPEQECEPCES